MFPFGIYASCASGVPECNDTGALGFPGDSAWIGLAVIAAVVVIIFVSVRLLSRRR
ncbi:MAG: hypothetical protein ABI400_04860 [Lacisediminihabitans sp.]